jgi:acetyl esterase/lipase
VCGVIGLAGAYELRQAFPQVQAIFGSARDWPRAQPATYASARSPPMLLLAGDGDRTIDPGDTPRLASALRAAGASARAELEPGIGHRAIVAAFADLLSFLAPVRDETLRFVTASADCRR